MRLKLTRGAQDDLVDIARFIGRDDAAAARKFVDRLKARARLAARHPRAGRHLPELRRDDLREVILGTYRIIYVVRPGVVIVLAFLEGHRLLRPDELPSSR